MNSLHDTSDYYQYKPPIGKPLKILKYNKYRDYLKRDDIEERESNQLSRTSLHKE
jgi:hypothetical protein